MVYSVEFIEPVCDQIISVSPSAFLSVADGSCIVFKEDESMTVISPSYELTEILASSHHDIQVEKKDHSETVENVVLTTKDIQISDSSAQSTNLPAGSPVKLADKNKAMGDVKKKPVVKLMTLEERGEGAVGWDVYQSYFQAANKPLLLVCLLLSFVLG